MKTKVKREIDKLYSLFTKPPKHDVKSVKLHIREFADKPEHYNKTLNERTITITNLKREVRKVIQSKRCVWCTASGEKVQKSLTDKNYIKEYNIDHLVADVEWFKKTDQILDYIGVSNSQILKDTAKVYHTRYYAVKHAYQKLYNKYYK